MGCQVHRLRARHLKPLRPAVLPRRSCAVRAVTGIAAALLVVLADQITKSMIRAHIQPGGDIGIVGPFQLRHTHNSGVAFGLLSSHPYLAVAGAAVVLCVLMWGVRPLSAPGLRSVLAVGLVIGGAVGNVIDRIRLGYVTDFLHVGPWPDFNVADTAVCVGAACILLQQLAAGRTGADPRSRMERDADHG